MKRQHHRKSSRPPPETTSPRGSDSYMLFMKDWIDPLG